MPIHFRCQACDRMLSIARRKAGQQVSCPKCGKMASVPAAAGVAVESNPHKQELEAMPLFERSDFEELLGPKAAANTPPKPNVVPLPVPVPVDDSSGEAELLPVDGVVISRGRMTLLAAVIAVLLAVSFAVGYFLARATTK